MTMKAKEENKVKRVISSRWFLVVALVIAVFFAFVFARAYYQDYKVKQQIESLKEDVKNLQTKKLESMEILKYVTSDNFVEEKARIELNMKQPGENVIILKNVNTSEREKLTTEEEIHILNNPIKWWYYFTHKDIKN